MVYFESLDSSEAESTNETDLSSMSEHVDYDDPNLEEEDEDLNGSQNPPLRFRSWLILLFFNKTTNPIRHEFHENLSFCHILFHENLLF